MRGDRHGDLVESNDAFWGLTHGVAPALLEAPVSVSRLFLHPDGMAPRIVNFDLWAWHVINALQREAIRNPNDRITELVAELEEMVPDRPQAASPVYLGFAVPLHLNSEHGELRLMTTVAHFGTAIDTFAPASPCQSAPRAGRGTRHG